MVMVTSAANTRWPGDILVEDFETLGLPIPSVIRTEKIATLEVDGANFVGRLPDVLWRQVRDAIQRNLAYQ